MTAEPSAPAEAVRLLQYGRPLVPVPYCTDMYVLWYDYDMYVST